jgi:hypothetical protein
MQSEGHKEMKAWGCHVATVSGMLQHLPPSPGNIVWSSRLSVVSHCRGA